MTKCPACGTESEEYTTMIEYLIAVTLREVICQYIDQKTGLGVMNIRNELMQLLKDEKETPENITCWFERMI